ADRLPVLILARPDNAPLHVVDHCRLQSSSLGATAGTCGKFRSDDPELGTILGGYRPLTLPSAATPNSRPPAQPAARSRQLPPAASCVRTFFTGIKMTRRVGRPRRM